MNLVFTRYNLNGARNEEGAVVCGLGRELMLYERGNFKVPVEVYFKGDVAVVYRPRLPSPLPADMTSGDVHAEIRAGVAAATDADVEWKDG